MFPDSEDMVTVGTLPGGGFDRWKPQPKDVTEPFMLSNIRKVFDKYWEERGWSCQLTFLEILDAMAVNPVRLAHVLAWLVDCGYMTKEICHRAMVLDNCQPYERREVYYSKPKQPFPGKSWAKMRQEISSYKA